jgi:hypothetical protein
MVQHRAGLALVLAAMVMGAACASSRLRARIV